MWALPPPNSSSAFIITRCFIGLSLEEGLFEDWRLLAEGDLSDACSESKGIHTKSSEMANNGSAMRVPSLVSTSVLGAVLAVTEAFGTLQLNGKISISNKHFQRFLFDLLEDLLWDIWEHLWSLNEFLSSNTTRKNSMNTKALHWVHFSTVPNQGNSPDRSILSSRVVIDLASYSADWIWLGYSGIVSLNAETVPYKC